MFQLIGEGDNAMVYAFQDKVVKKYKSPGQMDHLVLADLQATGCVPKLFGFKPDRFVVMEFINGETLDEINPYDVLGETWEARLRETLYKVVACGYLPCDLSFENIMLTDDGEFKLVDVGDYLPIKEVENWMINRHIEKALDVFRRNFVEKDDEEEYGCFQNA